MSKVSLHRSDIEKIVETLQKFPDVNFFELKEHGHSGIGSLLDMAFETKVNEVKGKLVISIHDESSW